MLRTEWIHNGNGGRKKEYVFDIVIVCAKEMPECRHERYIELSLFRYKTIIYIVGL